MTADEDVRHNSPAPVGRRLPATYAFAGAAAQLTRTAPLLDGEEVLLHGAMRLRRARRLPRPTVLRLTTQRLSLLAHHAFRSDWVWDVPRAAVGEVHAGKGAVVVSWSSDDAEGIAVATLAGWTGRPALDTSLRDAGAVADVLRSWLDARDVMGRA